MSVSNKQFSWETPITFLVGDPSGLEVLANLDPTTQSTLFVTGIGMRVRENNVYTISLEVAPIECDGTLGDRLPVINYPGDHSALELFVNVPAGKNEVVVGIAVGAHGNNVTSLAIYTRQIDPYLGGLVPSPVNTYAVGEGTYNQVWLADCAGQGLAEQSSVITGVAARYSDNSLIALAVQAATMTTQFDLSGVTPPVAVRRVGKPVSLSMAPVKGRGTLTRKPGSAHRAGGRRPTALPSVRSLATDAPDVIPTLLNLLLYACDAYKTVQPDGYFSSGQNQRVDGGSYSYPTKQAWLSANGYRLITANTLLSPLLHFWGIAVQPPGSSEIVVAFRGTEIQGYNIVAAALAQDWCQEVFLLTDIIMDAPGVDVLELWNGEASVPMTAWDIQTSTGTETVNVHTGFLFAYQLIQQSVRDQITSLLAIAPTPVTTIRFVGHSLGGALAALASVDFLGDTPLNSQGAAPDIEWWAYGCPSVGDQGFCELLANACASPGSARGGYQVKRGSCYTDIVPCIPTEGYVGLTDVRFYAVTSSQISVPSSASSYLFIAGHASGAYYLDLESIHPSTVASGIFSAGTVITSLEIVLTTGNKWWAGTDDPVTISALGTSTTISGAGESLEGGDDRFTLNFPSGSVVGSLADSRMDIALVDDQQGWAPTWYLESAEIIVNGKSFTTVPVEDWLGPGGFFSFMIGSLG